MPLVVETGTVAASERLRENLWLMHLELPQIAPHVRPGQFLLVKCADPEYPDFDPYLPRAFFPFALDRRAGRLSLLVERSGRASAWLCSRREGDSILAHGPVGKPVAPARLTRHLLLMADSTIGVASLALLAAEAAQRGCSVTLVENVGPASGNRRRRPDDEDTSLLETGVPPQLLRADVEYRATNREAGGLLGALPGILPWADEIVIAAAPTLLDTLGALRRSRAAPFTLHANLPLQALPLLQPQPGGGGDLVPCGTGVCGACAVPTTRGTRLFCQDGPAFPIESLRLVDADLAELHDPVEA